MAILQHVDDALPLRLETTGIHCDVLAGDVRRKWLHLTQDLESMLPLAGLSENMIPAQIGGKLGQVGVAR